MMFDGGMGWWMLFAAAFFVFFWIGVIALGLWLVDSFDARQRGDADTPLEIARERYAKGEISSEEFGRIRRDLRKAA